MTDLQTAIDYCLNWCAAAAVRVPRPVLLDALEAFKTTAYFERVLLGYVFDLYNKEITEAEFVDQLAGLVEQQLRRAFSEGMRANGLDPIEDMIPEWEAAYQDIVTNEYSFIDQFGADIVSGNYTLAQIQARAGLWSQRYADTVNQAILITAAGKDRLQWHLGSTEHHCPYCRDLDGIVAFAKEWDELGVHPQGGPNPALTGERDGEKGCEGWLCDCSCTPTDKRRSPKAFETIMNIVGK